ncbi:DUF4348 domain-containing protein [Prevotella sp. A2931]|uniref:DUF4348 domain-containing protein n=1 Tax=Prevotella illustrans TaxID=2800387 RepID=A0ABS3M7S9_9BACT|nr:MULTISPECIES: DUF4348 domain-containing protein [Prevotella]MBO1364203.1 DUF4348 domain-containing protein [Prevotella illustrans]PTL25399.1 hypothetical protein C3V39_12170 [Prevotella sp. oral taxon 820]
MRKIFILISAIALLTIAYSTIGCSNKKPETIDTVSVAHDSLADTSVVDTIENIIAETPMPKAADELFDDFIFNFAANRKLQHKRIHFPLDVYKDGKKDHQIQKNEWKMEHFFMHQDFYTLIFDNKKQMNLVKDTTVGHVVIEKIFFDIKTVEQYLFNRINGQWMLTSINYKPMYQNQNASFLKFYREFVTDSAFQLRSVHNPLTFTGPDPDDDFSTVTGTLAPEQWPVFAPRLPHDMMYNIIYGQKYTESNQKIFVIRGIANGLETELTFKRLDGMWKLVKLSM